MLVTLQYFCNEKQNVLFPTLFLKGVGFKNKDPLFFVFQGITESFGAAIQALSTTHLTDGVINRSKRMILDTLGVGLLGTRTSVFNKVLQYSQVSSLFAPHINPHCKME